MVEKASKSRSVTDATVGIFTEDTLWLSCAARGMLVWLMGPTHGKANSCTTSDHLAWFNCMTIHTYTINSSLFRLTFSCGWPTAGGAELYSIHTGRYSCTTSKEGVTQDVARLYCRHSIAYCRHLQWAWTWKCQIKNAISHQLKYRNSLPPAAASVILPNGPSWLQKVPKWLRHTIKIQNYRGLAACMQRLWHSWHKG